MAVLAVTPHPEASWGITRQGDIYAIHCFLLDPAAPAASQALVSNPGIGRARIVDAATIRAYAGSLDLAHFMIAGVRREGLT